ncbi:D-alanyl-D-alanine carboxypeptidase/D-alanyl-D-alanine-endopeptidase [Corynebacterium lizhenjunii]|uniref:D-alanyl-D-alanine carboxypeptidase/D-alanyl-D-alanine-endopeptidase n=1 Tax=Corynebacterium lizhenjunii TaxID=2709394 RepID=A0A7T0KFN9_9CORY|nr:D-alanyl-D-alanine carboxypeptidase/D-alanyl-D-alanine-endopeptidase [Corynebacterium lizhenjunii]QPK79496.1 D-alanyl-D-alanine carboxypeptidase/D-alanyl-D-alanine-endopeptidase [Corynebacterium lizhenjunii]
MNNKRVWWATALLLSGAVAATATAGVVSQRDVSRAPAFEVPTPPPLLAPAEPADTALADAPLDSAFQPDKLGTFGGLVINTHTGQVVWERDGGRPLVPASATKVLTLAAATWELAQDAVIRTPIFIGDDGVVVVRAAGDVWMTPEALDRAAAQLAATGKTMTAVHVDTSAWSGPAQARGWDPDNVDEGFVAPLEPAMIHGGRLGESTGDVPRSHTPAADVARELAARLGVAEAAASAGEQAGAGDGAPAPDATIVSPPLWQRAQEAMKHSDNVMAEAIGRELATARGAEASFAGSAAETLAVLNSHGIDTAGVHLEDNSGLSPDNRIPPAVLARVIAAAVADPAARPVLGYLPVAGGEGTLYSRYGQLPGRGWVRAKTGTLTDTSALVGTAVGESGTVYAFAFLSNDSDILLARAALDRLASALVTDRP